MKIKFGNGDVSVTTAAHGEELQGDTPSTMLIIEPGMGTGIINEEVPERYRGDTFDLEEFEESPDKIVLEFGNIESLDVVIDKLQLIRKDFEDSLRHANR